MSRAFVKEDGAQPDEDPPERPISSHPNYVTARGEARFGALVVWRRPDGSLARARIVGEDEAEEGGELLSWTSPLAQALLGLKPGDSFQAGAEGERGVIVSIEPGD